MNFFSKRIKAGEAQAFPGFDYRPTQLVRFLQSGYTFIILLDDERIIHFEPENAAAFSDWLALHRVPDSIY